jgi:hypothetical protein
MKTQKRARAEVDRIWADGFHAGDSLSRADAVRRGDVNALIRLAIRIS